MSGSHDEDIQVEHEDFVFRCKQCGKLLAKECDKGHLEIKCPRCSTLNTEIDSILGQMIVTSPDGRILHINQVAAAVTGFTLDESIGKYPSDLWGGQMTPEFYADLWRVIKVDKKPYTGRVSNKNKSGDIYDVDLVITPVLDPSGDVLFYICIEDLKKKSMS